MASANTLYYGDNLDVLRRYIPDESVDLIYLDPPFKSDQDYNILFAEQNGSRSAAQIKAFGDTWRWDAASASAYEDVVEKGGKVSLALQAFRKFLGHNDMLAYLSMMAPRLLELHRVLKPTGSIYLHCDPTAAHYLRMLLDAIFGPMNFRNEIVWKRVSVHSDAMKWSPVVDYLLYYGKSETITWNRPYGPYDSKYVEEKYRYEDPDGRKYTLGDLTSPNPRPNMMYAWKGFPSPRKGWRFSKETMAQLDAEGRIWYPEDKGKRPRLNRYFDEQPGVLLSSIWTDIPPINSQAKERLGYPTQKPEALLERIISASSNPGDVVLDPFCGCGTAVSVAGRLKRKWIGIDITHLAITLIKHRLQSTFGKRIKYTVIGEPVTLPDAQALAELDRYQFQWWALGLVGARPTEAKKGADQGIDGRLFFHDERGGKTKQIILSVKSGKPSAQDVRDLRAVVERENAQIGVLITLRPPTQPMRSEAATLGQYQSPWGKHPRLQILTIEELLRGMRIDYPALVNITLKRAPKIRCEFSASQPDLPALDKTD